jgi:hypothetical protein
MDILNQPITKLQAAPYIEPTQLDNLFWFPEKLNATIKLLRLTAGYNKDAMPISAFSKK